MSISHGEPTTKLTYDDYVLFPNDGKRHEIINGRHYMNAAPSPRHQAVSRHIHAQLYQQIEQQGLGEVIYAPIDVQLSETDVVQPDLVVVLKENRIITTTKIKGVPELVVEILSKSTCDYDRQLKKQLYEQAGIPEYWIVDPENQSINQFKLHEGLKYQVNTVSNEIVFDRTGATVDLSKVW
jgi:Uma2 family endonuclease